MSTPEIVIEVPGRPPIKNEAVSMLSARHGQAVRVRDLLTAARAAADRVGWTPQSVDLALDLVVRGPDRPPGDATNFLGGVGDVLQTKTGKPNLDIAYLGDLASVALYLDDRQIRQISYREEPAPEANYTVRIRPLAASTSPTPVPVPVAVAVDPGAESATDRGHRITDVLATKGAQLGFGVQREYPVPGGRIDLVWLAPPAWMLPGIDHPLPVLGFEIESSWRTRKHLKGDYLNLHDLGAACGVLVLLGDGENVDATRRFAEALVSRPGPRVLVWAEHDVERLLATDTDVPPVLIDERPVAAPNPSLPTAERHIGKFRALWEWLRGEPVDRLPASFADVERVIGMPLPPSCRKHPAHWSSYDGSAIARAIHDAGWTATQVNLRDESLVFVRRPRHQR